MQTSHQETILVTGGCGFIGTHLVKKLRTLGHRIIVLDLKDPATRIENVEYIKGDVRNRDLLRSLIEGTSPLVRTLPPVSSVYHFAATVSVPLCQKDPQDSYSNNFGATIEVLEALRLVQSKRPVRLIFASTAAVYAHNGKEGIALRESDAAHEFFSFYAAQKHASEQAIQLYWKTYGLPAMIFRFFNVFGPGQDPTSPYSGVITIFANAARTHAPLRLNDGGIQTRDFVSVHDLTWALSQALQQPLKNWDAKPINLGSGKHMTVRELAKTIVSITGAKSELVDAPPREGDVIHSLASIARAQTEIGYTPQIEVRAGLQELLSTLEG